MMTKRVSRLALCLLMALSLLAGALPAALAAEDLHGFKLVEQSQFTLVNAEASLYEHEKTGALLLVLENEDTNRTFDISFRTPVHDDMGVPHVFEHATLGGSRKYPSKSLFFNLSLQTYNTYMNAMTTDIMTTYPVASLSEDQLLRYADYYTDSVLNPMLMEDSSIFEEEAWRYAMSSEDGKLEMAGTVYTEMKGAYTIQTAARFNFLKTIFPGCMIGNSFGGDPQHIPEMTFEDLTSYHEAYYHPSNSLTILYGKFTKLPEFMELLDGYFSAFEKKEFTFEDPGYTPIAEAQTARHDFPVEATSDTANGAVVYYGFLCQDATEEDERVMDLLTTLLGESSSYFQQEMKKRLPSAKAGCYYDNAAPETVVVFSATGLNEDQAPEFKAIVDESLAHVAENGFDKEAVEAVAASTRLDLLLISEESSVGPQLLPSMAYTWTATGDTVGYQKYVDNTANYLPFMESGAYQALVAKYLQNNPRTALSVTAPAPGLKEKQEQVLAEALETKRAQMTPEEITALEEKTAAFGQDADDASALVKQLQAVDVSSLPVEARIYEVTDETGEDQVRRMNATAEVSGVGQVLLLLDAGALPQEDIHWFKLFTSLLGEVDTQKRDNAALSAMMTRYLYDAQMRISVYTGETGKECLPTLRVSFKALDEDLAPAYDLVYEILFESKLDDAKRVADVVSQAKTSLKQTITNNAFNTLVYRAFSKTNPGFAYFNYANFLDFYTFLEQAETLLAEQPEVALAKLAEVQAFLKNRVGATSGFVGSVDSQAVNREAADAFLARLDAEPREKVAYQLPEIAQTEALVVDSAVQYNLIYAPYEDLGLTAFSGAMEALTGFVSDAFLLPQLRDQYGAYGVQHGATEDGMFILSFRDPNVAKTFEVYGQLPQWMAEAAITQEELEGYILSAYSGYALPGGELAGGLSALIDTIDGQPQERVLTWMEELKGVTVETVMGYAKLYQELFDKGLRSTAGSASKIEENKALYQTVLNPFAIKDQPRGALTDVVEGDCFFDAINFVLDNKLMEPRSEDTFGAQEPLTAGEYAATLFVFIGGGGSPEESMAALGQYGLINPALKVDDVMTREEVADHLHALLDASGVDLKTDLPEMPELADADQVDEDMVDVYRFMLGHGLFPLTEDKALAPQDPATRADLAFSLKALDEF